MNKQPKIAVIGGTGKAGRYLIEALLSQGYTLRLLLRNRERYPIPHSSVEVVLGDARAYEAVRALTAGCVAIISTVGQPVGEPTIFSQATQNVLRAMQEWGIQRYVVLTGLNVATLMDQKSPWVQAATHWMLKQYPNTTADKQVEYELLRTSAVDWTLVRLPLIELTDELIEPKVSLYDCPGERISATTLAHFLVYQLTDTTYHKAAPFLANG